MNSQIHARPHDAAKLSTDSDSLIGSTENEVRDRSKRLVLPASERYIRLLNSHDAEGVLALFGDTFVFEDHGVQFEADERLKLRFFLEQGFIAFPNAKRVTSAIYCDGALTTLLWRCTASWQEPSWIGGARTVRVDYPGVSLLRQSGDRICSLEEFYDQTTARRYQFGLTFKPYVEV